MGNTLYITKGGEKGKPIESIDSEKKKECFSSINQFWLLSYP